MKMVIHTAALHLGEVISQKAHYPLLTTIQLRLLYPVFIEVLSNLDFIKQKKYDSYCGFL